MTQTAASGQPSSLPDPDDAAAGDASSRRFLIVFTLLSLTMGISVGVAKIVTSLYALHLGAGPAQIGLITSGGMVGMLLMSLPVGFLVDRFGPRRLFLLGSALGGVTYALVTVVASPWWLLGATTVVGFFMPLRFVSLNTVFFSQMSTLGDAKAGWSRATHMSGMFLIGPALGAVLVAALGYAGTWWLIAASFVVTIAVSPLVMGRYGNTRRGPAASGIRGMASGITTLLRDPELRAVNVIDFVGQGATMYTTTFVIVIALQVFHLDAAHASAHVTAWGAMFIATLFVGGSLTTRLGASRSLLLGFALVALALVTMGSTGSAAWLWPGVLMQGLGAGLVQLVNLGRIARAGARLGQGRVSGMNLLVGPLGGLIGSSLGGLAGQHFGLQAVFFGFLPGYALLAAWQVWHLRRGPRPALGAVAQGRVPMRIRSP